MATRKKGGLQFFADFSQLQKSISAAWGMLETMDDVEYQDSLMDTAFNTAALEFNREAAAYAAAGGQIKHMFEWGTQGINTARTNMRPNPMSERARLWTPRAVGRGFNRQLDFDFKPSVAFVPKPTTRDTGMSSEVIAQMRDHIFWNKAMVMESGMTVTVRPQEAQFLLIPLYRDREYTAARPNDFKRGYMLQNGPNVMRPGARSAGRFNAYWVAFWNGRGNAVLNETVQKEIDTDYEIALRGSSRPGPMRPPVPESVRKAITADKRRIERNAKARARRAAKAAEVERRAE